MNVLEEVGMNVPEEVTGHHSHMLACTDLSVSLTCQYVQPDKCREKDEKPDYQNWKTLSHLGGAILSIVYFQSKMMNIPICDKFVVNIYYLM